MSGLPGILAVDPVPWARSQMAFTLGFHIILVPLGVAWAFMALVANHRAIKHDDADALLLAQRWSKYMAVTFAVGAVTGTVLTFEFGLLWPNFMGKFGAAFGVPFAVEGLFFFTEAIFIAIYIYGWRRLKPWPHFWTGVPIVIAGIGGTVSVVAANSWMNQPQGFTLDSSGKVATVDPMSVIFNKAMPYEAAHMLVAAYLVGGFLIASVYAVGMLRGRRDRYHRLGFLIPFTIAAIATPVQMGVGDTLARWVYNNEPTKFAAIELVPQTTSDVPETLFGHLNCNGTVTGGIPIPGLASILSDPADGHEHRHRRPRLVPGQRPTDHTRGQHRPPRVGRHGRHRHAAVPAVAVVRAHVALQEAHAEDEVVPAGGVRGRHRVDPGARGGLGGHRGRSTTMDRERLHEGGAGRHDEPGRVDHVPRRRRHLPHRGRDHDPGAEGHVPPLAGAGVPGRRRVRRAVRAEQSTTGHSRRGRCVVSTAVAIVLFVAHHRLRGLRRCRLRRRVLGPDRRGAERGERPRALIDHSIGPVWEANHVWLIFTLVIMWTAFSEAFASITLTLFVPLTLAALGIVLRGSSFAFRKAVLRTRDQRNFGAAFAAASVLVPYCMGAVAGAIASGRVPAGGEAGDPWTSWVNPTSILGGLLAVSTCAFLSATYMVWDARRMERRRTGRVLPAPGDRRRRRRPACWPSPASSSSTPTPPTSSTA